MPCVPTLDKTMSTLIRRYGEMIRYSTLEDRFEYLKLKGDVGAPTFGFDRWINQQFYRSTQWKQVRNEVIARDLGLDLGVEGYEIYDKVIVHHMNPMTPEDIDEGIESILQPEFLVCTSHMTHNAIHFGDAKLLARPLEPRRAGDTRLW